MTNPWDLLSYRQQAQGAVIIVSAACFTAGAALFAGAVAFGRHLERRRAH